jgi:hypothetical protein
LSSTSLHEAAKDLSAETREMHRAITSLIEELEAVDWYAQRIDAARDRALARILEHNRDEEKEHACMTLEWIRRRDPAFDRMLRRFLFTDEPIVEVGHGDDAEGRDHAEDGDHTEDTDHAEGADHAEDTSAADERAREPAAAAATDARRDASLGIGSLQGQANLMGDPT